MHRLRSAAPLPTLVLLGLLAGGATRPGCWPASPTVQCDLAPCPYCPGEYVKDSNGCPTCQCDAVGDAGANPSGCANDSECSEGRTCQPDPTDPCNAEPSNQCLASGRRLCLPEAGTCGGPPAYRDAYRGDEREVAKGVLSGRCSVVKSCGSLSWVDCHSDVDGPAYYVESATGCVLEVCGGACMGPVGGEHCVACPPPEWTCAP